MSGWKPWSEFAPKHAQQRFNVRSKCATVPAIRTKGRLSQGATLILEKYRIKLILQTLWVQIGEQVFRLRCDSRYGAKLGKSSDEEIGVPDAQPSAESVQAIAQAMLAEFPSSLVAVYHDSKGNDLRSTVTPTRRAAVIRASLRSLPTPRAKQVTLAACGHFASDVRDAATEAA